MLGSLFQLHAQEVASPISFSGTPPAPYRFAGLVRTKTDHLLSASTYSRGSGVVAGHPRVALTAGHVVYEAKNKYSPLGNSSGRWVQSVGWFGVNQTATEPSYANGTLLEVTVNSSYDHLKAYEAAATKERQLKQGQADSDTASAAKRTEYNAAKLRTSELDLVALTATSDLIAGGQYADLETSPTNAALLDATTPKLLCGFPQYEYENTGGTEQWGMYKLGPINRAFDIFAGHPGILAPVPAVSVWEGNSGGPWFVRTAAKDYTWSVATIVARGDGRGASVTSASSRALITAAAKRAGPAPTKVLGDFAVITIAPGQTIMANMGETLGDVDTFRLKVITEGDYVIQSLGTLDLVGVLTGTGQPTVMDDNGSTDGNFMMTAHLKPQSYDIRVRGASPAVRGNYSCSVSAFSFIPGEPNVSVGTLIGSKETALTKYSSADTDYQTQAVTLPAHSSGKAYTQMTFRLRNVGGGTLDLAGLPPSVYVTGPNSSAFTVVSDPVLGLTNGVGHFGDFTVTFHGLYTGRHQAMLSIGTNDIRKPWIRIPLLADGKGFATSDDHINLVTAAIAAGSGIIDAESLPTANIDYETDTDIFILNVANTNVYRLYTEGTTDTTGVLYQLKNGKAVKLESANDLAGDRNFSITRVLAPGTYYIVVGMTAKKALGSYTLRVSHSAASGLLSVESPNKTLILDDSTEATASNGCDFGKGTVGKAIVKTFTLRNIGITTLTLRIPASTSVSNASNFSTTQPKLSILASGATTTFTISYFPLAGAASITSVYIVAYSAGLADDTYTFDVRGGVDSIPALPIPTHLAASKKASYALTAVGNLKVWGYNYEGILGVPMPDQYTSNILTPTSPSFSFTSPVTIAAGDGSHAHVALANGYVVGWGDPYYVSLGDGVVPSSNPPIVTIPVPATRSWGNTATITQLAMGTWHSIAVTSAGGVWAWGQQDEGELGNGVVKNATAATPVAIGSRFGGATVLRVAAGTNHTLALDSEGNVWTWGINSEGSLGLGTLTGYKSTPSRIPATSFASSRVLGIGCTSYASFAYTEAGILWAWGNNEKGTLGDGTFTDRSRPVKVLDPNTGNAHTFGGESIVQIAGGGDQVGVLTSQGSVWTWGEMVNAEVDMSYPFSHTPTEVTGWTTRYTSPQLQVAGSALASEHVIEIAIGGERGNYNINPGPVLVPLSLSHTLLQMEDGSVQAFGSNAKGQLGDGTTISRTTPVTAIP